LKEQLRDRELLAAKLPARKCPQPTFFFERELVVETVSDQADEAGVADERAEMVWPLSDMRFLL